MGALAREMAGALRESMNLLRVENQARENTVESRASFLTREFLRAKPDEFYGGPEPKKVDEWLEQTVKTFEMLHIDDSELRVTLANKYLPPAARKRLRQEFKDLKQLDMTVAEFEALYSSLSRFAPELVATEERRCIEFENKLKTKIFFKIVGNMIRNYDRLVESTTYIEVSMQAKEERLRSSRSRSHESQGGYRENKKSRGTFSSQTQPQQSKFTFPLPSLGSGRSPSGGFMCFKCGQPGHKAFLCPQKGEGQLMLPPPPPNQS
ncbi:uncharacterized protein LOC114272654 [Camellia sinensis]|uniref:uncharacterized protein LOC114272654 n=1 Tax=Camellia sinensis TaxID=4442 RepID=UPI001036D7DA|nr:uncharacterized protein LOC114272654 [Camellia sinensis]